MPKNINQVQENNHKFNNNNNSKVKFQQVIYVESMKCPSAKKRGSIEMQCNLIHAYIIPVL